MNTNYIFDPRGLTDNFIVNTDSYKTSHFIFEPPKTTFMKSYVEARIGGIYNATVPFGLHLELVKYYENVRITSSMVNQAEWVITNHGLPFNRAGWDYIVNHRNGVLPLRIKAVKEGMLIPCGNVLATIENTDPNCAWLVSYVEPSILRAMWYGTTVATRAYEFRKVIKRYLEETGNPDDLPFKLIDFGARGTSSKESAEIGGAAHQTSFSGTDNIMGISAIMQYYEMDEMPSFSIPATEHTVTIMWTKEGEKDFFENAVKVGAHGGGMASVVSDTYDMNNALKLWGTDLKDTVLNSGGRVVVRPDSGVPRDQVLNAVKTLDHYFGSTVNSKGFKVLHDAVRVIQGDGISLESTEEILETLKSHGYSADNVTFGCGGYLLQDLTRDSLRFAMKGCYAVIDGHEHNIQKTVATDPTKASKAGNLTLIRNMNGVITTIDEKHLFEGDEILLDTVYSDGLIYRRQKFQDIRNLVASH